MSTPSGFHRGRSTPSLNSSIIPSPKSPVLNEFPTRNYANSVSTTSTFHYSTPQTPQTPHSQSSSGHGIPRYSIDVSLDNLTVFVNNLPHSQFKTTLDTVVRKLHQAMKATLKNHKDFYFWVCDFLGSLSRAIEMFGPVPKPQYIRDFTQVSWIHTLLEPFILLPLDKTIRQPLGHAQITAFTETCVVLKSTISKYRKLPCIYKDLIEELWDLLVEILAETEQGIVINYSFSLCQTILAKIPLCDDLICKIVLVRAITINYGAQYMVRFRILHARLFECLVIRAKKTNEAQYIDDISSEIIRCIGTETNPEALSIFKYTLKLAQGEQPINPVREVHSVADFKARMLPPLDDKGMITHKRAHSKDPRIKSIFGPRARVSMHSSSTQSSTGDSTLRKSISMFRLHSPLESPAESITSDNDRPRARVKFKTPEAENEVSFEGYREFRVSVRRAIATKLRSWRSTISRDSA